MNQKLLLGAVVGVLAAFGAVFYMDNFADQRTSKNESFSEAECSQMASKEKAEKLLKRLFQNAEILEAEPLPLNNMKSVCLLEVEMLVDTGRPDTRGFVYVLPDGERFLNGPLMDKRSQVGLSPTTGEIEQALKEQEQKLKEVFTMPASPNVPAQQSASLEQPAVAPAQSSLIEQPSSAESIPSPSELREKLISKLQGLPSIETTGGSKSVYVLLDPLCTHCKNLFNSSKEITEKHDVKFHWIPLFLNEGGWALSTYLLKTKRDNPEMALDALAKVMSGKMTEQDVTAALTGLTEADYAAPKDATAVFIELAKHNSRMGTPLVVFRKPDGGIEVISGMPHEQDWVPLGIGS
ncbi:hypothetical protein VQ574_21390 (plasmid) [Stutzerimonas frequens]|uniref:hypothetical protein n=1 Tax=Stutzerimonas frequens TaxID=2968969 RepID=UPI002DBD092D|nr:hypothetical protein [Stutzerimonas frequens]WRW29281.1 hypothetical protein VQ574_21390 [Stutzerimonas frequens]